MRKCLVMISILWSFVVIVKKSTDRHSLFSQTTFYSELDTDIGPDMRSEARVRSRGSSDDLCQPEKFNSLVISSKPDFMTTSKTMPKSDYQSLTGTNRRWWPMTHRWQWFSPRPIRKHHKSEIYSSNDSESNHKNINCPTTIVQMSDIDAKLSGILVSH